MRCNMTLDLRRVPDRQSRRPTPLEECPVDPAAASIAIAANPAYLPDGSGRGDRLDGGRHEGRLADRDGLLDGRGRSRGTGGLPVAAAASVRNDP